MITIADIQLLATHHGDWNERRGLVSAVHHEVARGVFLHIGLGPTGLVVWRGPGRVGIPIEQLVAVAVEADRRLLPRPEDKPKS